MTSRGILWVDRGIFSPLYRTLTLPENWSIAFSSVWGGCGGGMRWCLDAFPNASSYGWLADDTFPRTPRWDKRLEKVAGRWNLAYARDNWLSESSELGSLMTGRNLSSGLVWGGDLVRAVGWWALPGARQAGHDVAWQEIVRPLDLFRYVSEVVVEHENWRTLRRSKDISDWFDQNGVSAFEAWVSAGEHLLAIERVREALDGSDLLDSPSLA